MATPRVFLSSTCYDLSEVRDSLSNVIKTFGFEPCLSERGDVFYHPDLHTHVSCANEISSCQLFILLIGGRFGGTYIADKTRSIVNAEYAAAREQNIPVFTFVKKDVLDDHRFFNKNKGNDALKELDFPSIDKRENAEKIFAFIDEVRRSEENNGFFPFEYSGDIETLLKKQWAGMFFDFLRQRQQNAEIQNQRKLLSDLTSATAELGVITKKMYLALDKQHAPAVISDVESKSEADRFFSSLFEKVGHTKFLKLQTAEEIASLPTDVSWTSFCESTGDFTVFKDAYREHNLKSKVELLASQTTNRVIIIGGESMTKLENLKCHILKKQFDSYKKLSKTEKISVLGRFVGNDDQELSPNISSFL